MRLHIDNHVDAASTMNDVKRESNHRNSFWDGLFLVKNHLHAILFCVDSEFRSKHVMGHTLSRDWFILGQCALRQWEPTTQRMDLRWSDAVTARKIHSDLTFLYQAQSVASSVLGTSQKGVSRGAPFQSKNGRHFSMHNLIANNSFSYASHRCSVSLTLRLKTTTGCSLESSTWLNTTSHDKIGRIREMW